MSRIAISAKSSFSLHIVIRSYKFTYCDLINVKSRLCRFERIVIELLEESQSGEEDLEQGEQQTNYASFVSLYYVRFQMKRPTQSRRHA